MGHKPRVVMKNINAKSSITIPDGVTVEVKSRFVKVTGPRGVLSKSFKHMSSDIFKTDDKTIKVEKWFGQAKELSAIKTTCSHIQNMIIGVTKGFKYRMKMVYAHFPTNVQITDGGSSVTLSTSLARRSSSTSTLSRVSRSSVTPRTTLSSPSRVTALTTCPAPVLLSTRSVLSVTRISVSSLTVSTFPTRVTSLRIKCCQASRS